MYLVSLSQPHNAASVIELSRSLEFEHEVRREVTLEVMRWFGQADDADERWEMDVEKVVGLVGLRQHKNDPISEDELPSAILSFPIHPSTYLQPFHTRTLEGRTH
ncbi:hypothetical protein BGY98DRAFT_937437 [Russula aff. rugulosa BPL654]|nr:hypothetical protein BGY98DRAFT_937437 [Russula aff. rugulosa BPL654]